MSFWHLSAIFFRMWKIKVKFFQIQKTEGLRWSSTNLKRKWVNLENKLDGKQWNSDVKGDIHVKLLVQILFAQTQNWRKLAVYGHIWRFVQMFEQTEKNGFLQTKLHQYLHQFENVIHFNFLCKYKHYVWVSPYKLWKKMDVVFVKEN